MDKLIEAMKRVLADSYAMYIKTHYYHWNVEGPDFYQLHLLFERVYLEVYESIDTTAEHIRALGAYAPGSFGRYGEMTTIDDENTVPMALEMVNRLAIDNQKVIATLKIAQKMAEDLGEVGVSNYLQDRIDNHQKHAWMLRATAAR
jgi:starvation-inducible DNA-binding protein